MANENNQNVMQELEQVNDKIDRIGTNLESFIADVRQNYVTKKELNLILDLIRQEIAHLQEGQKKRLRNLHAQGRKVWRRPDQDSGQDGPEDGRDQRAFQGIR